MQLRLSRNANCWHNEKMGVVRGGFFTCRNDAFSQPALRHTGKCASLSDAGHWADTAMCYKLDPARFVLGGAHYHNYD